MLGADVLRSNARLMFEAAKTLGPSDRTAGVSAYLCGYALEFQLKARIVATLGLAGYPSDKPEFEHAKATYGHQLRTHDLEELLKISGLEAVVKPGLWAEWSICLQWSPETRYEDISNVSKSVAESMLDGVEKLLPNL